MLLARAPDLLLSEKAKCLYETCSFIVGPGSFGAPAASSSSDKRGMPWDFMEINNYLWEFFHIRAKIRPPRPEIP
jgi:hypothetical protein